MSLSRTESPKEHEALAGNRETDHNMSLSVFTSQGPSQVRWEAALCAANNAAPWILKKVEPNGYEWRTRFRSCFVELIMELVRNQSTNGLHRPLPSTLNSVKRRDSTLETSAAIFPSYWYPKVFNVFARFFERRLPETRHGFKPSRKAALTPQRVVWNDKPGRSCTTRMPQGVAHAKIAKSDMRRAIISKIGYEFMHRFICGCHSRGTLLDTVSYPAAMRHAREDDA